MLRCNLRWVDKIIWMYDPHDPDPYQKPVRELQFEVDGKWHTVPRILQKEGMESRPPKNHRFESSELNSPDVCMICGHTYDWHIERLCGFGP